MKLGFIAIVMACCAMFAHAGEPKDRAAIAAEFTTAFDRGDFASIETRYARALAGKEKLPSGLFVSGRMVRAMFSPVEAMNRGPKDADVFWNPIEEKAREWVARYPKSVLAAMALSRAYRAHGWAIRGGGYASGVTKEDFARFRTFMRLGSEALTARSDSAKSDPNWQWQMLDVARVQSWPDENYRFVAQAALDTFPDNHDIYFELSLRMLPQWGGSMEALAGFADYAAERTKAAEGQAIYARIYSNVYNMLGVDRFKRGELDWPKIRGGFEDLVKLYPDSWNLNSYARMACDAGDKATAAQVLARIGDDVDSAAWPDRAAYVRCKNLAAG